MGSHETALVTGASSGIGVDLARCFARDGADVVLLARSEDALRALADELAATHGVDAHVLAVDLSAPDAVATIRDRLDADELTVDVLVNNAGFGARGRFVDLDAERQTSMIQVNVMALTALTRELLPGMIERGRGGVLNVASTAAFQPGPNMSVYYATKAYVLSFSEGLTEEVAGTGVTVTCLAPGPTKTPFLERADMEESVLFESGVAMTPEAVAQTGYDGYRNGRALVVPGAANAVGAFATRLMPRALSRKVAGYLNG